MFDVHETYTLFQRNKVLTMEQRYRNYTFPSISVIYKKKHSLLYLFFSFGLFIVIIFLKLKLLVDLLGLRTSKLLVDLLELKLHMLVFDVHDVPPQYARNKVLTAKH